MNKKIILYAIILTIVSILIYLSAYNFLLKFNMKLYLMSITIMLLIIGSYLDIKYKHVDNIIIYPIIITLLLITIINIYTKQLNILSIISSIVLLYIYFKKSEIVIGGADVKILVPLFLSLTNIQLIIFIMLLGDILFTTILIKRFKNINISFFPIITLAYFMIFILDDILNIIIT